MTWFYSVLTRWLHGRHVSTSTTDCVRELKHCSQHTSRAPDAQRSRLVSDRCALNGWLKRRRRGRRYPDVECSSFSPSATRTQPETRKRMKVRCGQTDRRVAMSFRLVRSWWIAESHRVVMLPMRLLLHRSTSSLWRWSDWRSSYPLAKRCVVVAAIAAMCDKLAVCRSLLATFWIGLMLSVVCYSEDRRNKHVRGIYRRQSRFWLLYKNRAKLYWFV